MISWLQDVLTSRDFWINFSVAVLFLLLAKASAMFWRLLRHIRQSRQHHTVSGHWIGTCVLPSYHGNAHIEIWRIVQNREDIVLSFSCYPPDGAPLSHCRGMGVFRGVLLSAVYYTPSADTYESGVIAMRLKGRRLFGSYAQFDPNDSEEPFFSSDTSYCLTRVRLPLRQKVRMLLGLHPVLTFTEAKNIHDSIQPPIPATA